MQSAGDRALTGLEKIKINRDYPHRFTINTLNEGFPIS